MGGLGVRGARHHADDELLHLLLGVDEACALAVAVATGQGRDATLLERQLPAAQGGDGQACNLGADPRVHRDLSLVVGQDEDGLGGGLADGRDLLAHEGGEGADHLYTGVHPLLAMVGKSLDRLDGVFLGFALTLCGVSLGIGERLQGCGFSARVLVGKHRTNVRLLLGCQHLIGIRRSEDGVLNGTTSATPVTEGPVLAYGQFVDAALRGWQPRDSNAGNLLRSCKEDHFRTFFLPYRSGQISLVGRPTT
ncbi:hypothetical protein D3C87_1306830 [compost metagenome]